MSRAFVKEADEADTFDNLPDRPIGPEPNFVTPEGLAQIEAEVARLRAAEEAAKARDDKGAMAEIARDLRYWNARRATAELVPAVQDTDAVRFGLTVTIERGTGKRQSFRIVGLDEADPTRGKLSYMAPLARALTGKRVGETVTVGNDEAEIVAILALPAAKS